MKKTSTKGFRAADWGLMIGALIAAVLLCVCAGSVSIPLRETAETLWNALLGREASTGTNGTIILAVRLPRVLCVGLCGAALALCADL